MGLVTSTACLVAAALITRPAAGEVASSNDKPPVLEQNLALEALEERDQDELESTIEKASTLAGLTAGGWRILDEEASPERILLEAGEKDDLVLLLVRSERCETSHALEHELMAPSLKSETSRFARVVANAGSDVGQALLEAKNIASYPTLIIFDQDGNELARLFGISKPEMLGIRLQGIRLGHMSVPNLKERAIQNPFDVDLALELGRHHALRGDALEAKRHFARLFVLRRMIEQSNRSVVRGAADVGRLGDSGDFGSLRAAVESDLAAMLELVDTRIASAYFALAEHVYLRSRGDHKKALAIHEELRRRFPDSPEAGRAGLSIAVARYHLGSTRRARSEMKRYLEEHADQPDSLAIALSACNDLEGLSEWAADAATHHAEAQKKHAGLWSAAAALREATGDLEGSLEAARLAGEIDESRTWDRRRIARLEAILSEKERSSLEAEETVEDTEPLKPEETSDQL